MAALLRHAASEAISPLYPAYISPISRLYLAYIYQVGKWRRSYDTPPPEIELSSPYWPGNDNRYAHIPEEEIPLT